MKIADKLVTIAENEQKVYEAGKEKGVEVGNDAFWEAYQNGGNRTNYSSAFNYVSDEIYSPKYPITISGHSSYGNSMFGNATITDVKVPIVYDDAITGITSSLFSNARQLETIPLIHINENISFTAWFNSCGNLKNLTFEGVIGQSGIDLRWVPLLSKASIENVINSLSDTAEGKSITLSKKAVNNAFGEGLVEGYEYVDLNPDCRADNGYTFSISKDNGTCNVTVNGGIGWDEGMPTGGTIYFVEGELPPGEYELSFDWENDECGYFLSCVTAEMGDGIAPGSTVTFTVNEGDYNYIGLDMQGKYNNATYSVTLKRKTMVNAWEALIATKPNWTISLA